MEKFIKYKRFDVIFELTNKREFENDVQLFFDGLIKDGWEIIHYNENVINKESDNQPSVMIKSLIIIVLAGKRQEDSLKKVI